MKSSRFQPRAPQPSSPRHFATEWMRQAQLLSRRGDLTAAEGYCARILDLRPRDFEALNLKGVIVARQGRYAEAETLLRRALLVKPRAAEVHNDLGNVLRCLKRLDDALHSYHRALTLRPNFPEACNNIGNTLFELKRPEEALEHYAAALKWNPLYATAHFNRGVALKNLWRLPEALACFDKVIEISPDNREAHNNRGILLREMDRLEEALESFERALALDPQNAGTFSNHGLTLQNLQRPTEAIKSFDAALALRPGYARALHNRAYANLLAGNLTAGWRDFEYRWHDENCPLHQAVRNLGARWTGREPIEGKRVLVATEQGLGDMLQFCRYVPLLARRGAAVILEVQPPLRRLLGALEGVSELCDAGGPFPAFDYWCSLMSLPLAFGTDLASIPTEIPYLRAPPESLLRWRERLGPGRGLQVGLVWSGGLRLGQPEGSAMNRRRNVPLRLLFSLRHPDVEFFSLQKGEPAESEAAEAAGMPDPFLRDLAPELGDFADTAAVIENLDLLICVDTAVLHLAGALGRPTWVLNRFDTCWRWLLNRTDSPWYPSVRLYRQTALGDWEGVIERVRADLEALAAQSARRL